MLREFSSLLLLLSVATPGFGFEAGTVWKRDSQNLSSWGARKISTTDFVVVGSTSNNSVRDTAKLALLRMTASGDTVWLREYKDAGMTGWLPKTGGVEILNLGDGTYTLLCPREDSAGTVGIGVFRFNEAGEMLSREMVGRGYDFVNFAQHGGNVFVLGVKPGRVSDESVPVLLKYDRRMRLVDSLHLLDTADCRSATSFTTGDAITVRNDTLHIVGNQECLERTDGLTFMHLSQVYATLDTNLNFLKSRKFAAAKAKDYEFTFKGIMPYRNGAIVYGGFIRPLLQIVAYVDQDSLQWKTEFRSRYYFDDRAGTTENGNLLWCGYFLDCRLFDSPTGRQLDSTAVVAGSSEYGQPLRTLQWDGDDFIVVSNGRTGRVHFGLPAASVRRERPRARSGYDSRPFLMDGRRVAEEIPEKHGGKPHWKVRN